MKKRKPDLMMVLVVLVGMGVVATSIAQGMMSDERPRVEARR